MKQGSSVVFSRWRAGYPASFVGCLPFPRCSGPSSHTLDFHVYTLGCRSGSPLLFGGRICSPCFVSSSVGIFGVITAAAALWLGVLIVDVKAQIPSLFFF